MKNIIKTLFNDNGTFKITVRKPGEIGCEVAIRHSRREASAMVKSLADAGFVVRLSERLADGEWQELRVE